MIELRSNRMVQIARGYSIPKTMVHQSIIDFVNICNDMLSNHYRVEIPNMVTIIPEDEQEYNATFAYIIYRLADKEGLPTNSVYTIIETYLDSVKKDLLRGENSGIRGLVRFSISQVEKGYSVQTSISNIYREKSDVPVRVHTARQFKSDVNEALSSSGV